jgi:hypothetical protein
MVAIQSEYLNCIVREELGQDKLRTEAIADRKAIGTSGLGSKPGLTRLLGRSMNRLRSAQCKASYAAMVYLAFN